MSVDPGAISERIDAPHRLRRMVGRDPDEAHRAATPLELLFDLTFVVAFGTAGSELAHAMAAGHLASGAIAFTFCVFAICWGWINYSWFASAFDTDDWLFRLLTMVQMVGVIILALGIPEAFSSIDEGKDVDLTLLVVGYVVMRVSMVSLWVRVARQDPDRRTCAYVYISTILVGQLLWILLIFPELHLAQFLLLVTVPLAIETAGPIVAEKRFGGTPWHPHHVAERYGLLVIITLGEVVIGTVAAMSALVHDVANDVGWSPDAVIVLAAGIAVTFGMWWVYFSLPWAEVLVHHPERGFFWGYGHMLIFGSIAAVGAGLHTVEYYLEGHTELGEVATLLTLVLPLALYLLAIYVMYSVSLRAADPFHILLVVITAAVLVGSVALAFAGVSVAVCLAVASLAPWVTVVGYETVGHKHGQDHVERLRS